MNGIRITRMGNVKSWILMQNPAAEPMVLNGFLTLAWLALLSEKWVPGWYHIWYRYGHQMVIRMASEFYQNLIRTAFCS